MQESTTYLSKQMKFKSLVNDIQKSLDSKEYITLGQTFNEYVKQRWNISKAQAYRYLLSAKVLNQLNEFTILPNYECLCRTLAKYAKTTQQMKILWSSILLKVNNKLDLITTSLVGKVWKDICHDKRYSHICKYEEDIMCKIDNYLNEHSKQLRKKQMNRMYNNTNAFVSTSLIYPETLNTEVNNNYVTPINSPQISNEIITNQINYYNDQIYNEIVPVVPVTTMPLSPISQCSVISSEEDEYINNSIINFSNEILYSIDSSYIALNY